MERHRYDKFVAGQQHIAGCLSLAQFLDAFDQSNRIFDRRFFHDAVSEIENVSGSPAGLIQHLRGTLADHIGIGQQYRWIQIACTAQS